MHIHNTNYFSNILFPVWKVKHLIIRECYDCQDWMYGQNPPDRTMLWWKENEKKYPILSKLAKMNLAIPASQASTERSFSAAGNICTKKRSCLSPDHVEKLTIFHQNLKEFMAEAS